MRQMSDLDLTKARLCNWQQSESLQPRATTNDPPENINYCYAFIPPYTLAHSGLIETRAQAGNTHTPHDTHAARTRHDHAFDRLTGLGVISSLLSPAGLTTSPAMMQPARKIIVCTDSLRSAPEVLLSAGGRAAISRVQAHDLGWRFFVQRETISLSRPFSACPSSR